MVHVEYAETVRGHVAGEPAPGTWSRLTIHDVIENADQAAVDGGTWYTISDVTPR